MIDAAVSAKPTPRERLIVALDARGVAEAEHWVETLGDSVQFFKVGMELVYGGGGLDLIGRHGFHDSKAAMSGADVPFQGLTALPLPRRRPATSVRAATGPCKQYVPQCLSWVH